MLNKMNSSLFYHGRNRQGATIVLMLFLLVLVFIFVAFAIDIGRIQLAQLKLQGASDFASRAGAEAMARGVGNPDKPKDYEKAIRDEVGMIMTKSTVFGQPIGFDKNTQMSFGNAALSGEKFVFTPTGDGSMDSITNSLTVTPDLSQFPLVFGSFLGLDSVALGSGATTKVTDRDIVLVLDKSASMLIHDAGTIPVSDYNANLMQLEEGMYGTGDAYHPNNTTYPVEQRNTEFIINDGLIELSRMQALKLAILKFRDEIDNTRAKEQLGLTAYSDIANVTANAIDAPESIDIVAGLSTTVFDQIVGDGTTHVNGDGTQHISNRHASALEGESNDYDNFDFNYLRMRRHGMTNIADGIIKGADILYGPGRRSYATPILIVMTDGAHNMSSTPEAAATSVMSAHPDLLIYTITFGAGAAQGPMQTVAVTGNAEHFHAVNVNQLVDVFEQLATNAGVLVIE
jgi:Flp pilus assembly protein TadG